MDSHPPLNFDLLKVALASETYLREIKASEENQNQFIHSIKYSAFTAEQIFALIASCADPLVKSLLAIYLIHQKSFLDGLQDASILSQLTDHETHRSSRLNPFIHQLDVKTLTPNQLASFSPEVAISILCSISHFHQLSQIQVQILFGKYPQPVAINYWLNHYARLPNAYFILAHLINLGNKSVSTGLNRLPEDTREELRVTMIRHLELFNPVPALLFEYPTEDALILAIELYLNGHTHQNYMTFISQLTQRLLTANHPLSTQATACLISLLDQDKFNELNAKTIDLIKYSLRAKARTGDVTLFYDFQGLNPISMIQPLGVISQINLDEEERIRAPSVTEHPLAKILSAQIPLNSFNYFLMHYQGDAQQIEAVITQYLGYIAQEGCTAERRQNLAHLLILMSRADSDLSLRHAIFNALLHFPELYDEQIIYRLFLFDAKEVIRHFGQNSGVSHYQLLIDLCQSALRKFDQKRDKDLILLTTKVLQEATLELSVSTTQSIFWWVILRLKQCWLYGFTGFFSPNSPRYVASATDPGKINKDTSDELYYQPAMNVSELMALLKQEISLETLNQFTAAISHFALQAKPENELNLRFDLNRFVHSLMEHQPYDTQLEKWLNQNEPLLRSNCLRLSELLLIKGALGDLKTLLESPLLKEVPFNHLQDELSPCTPDLFTSFSQSATTNSIQDSVIENAHSLFQYGWNNLQTSAWRFFNSHQVKAIAERGRVIIPCFK